jgi:hypothetical protein
MSNGMMNQGNTKQTNRTANRTIHKLCKMFSTVMGNQTSTAMKRKIFWMLIAKILHSNRQKNKISNTDYLPPYLVKKDFVFFQ